MSQTNKPFKNFGPGDIIKDYLEALNWTQNDLADILGMAEKSINLILNNKQAITLETAKLLGKAFNQSPQFWINLDTNYRLRLNDETKKEKEAEIKACIKKYMPLSEMKKKGWIHYTTNIKTIEEAYKDFWNLDELDFSFFKNKNNLKYCARQNDYNFEYTAYYCLTWLQQAKKKAKKIKVNSYNKEYLKSLAVKIPEYTIKENGIIEFIKELENTGVKFIVVEHLLKTYLDGACFMDGDNPVIVYTGRHNRVDNFWFTLAHEIAHVLLHLSNNESAFLDNLDEKKITEKKEIEADKTASIFLQANKVIEEAKGQEKYFSENRLLHISKKLNLEPSLALGILQYNGLVDYRKLNRYKKEVLSKLI